jgi:redox-sensitive bicupin YhaK (pirin superfamily)
LLSADSKEFAMGFDRKILAVGQKRDVMEGAGEIVGRVLPQARLGLEPLDPFLMLDHFKMKPGGPGFPEHPHRGFEILTYLRSGWGSHKDNLGNQATVQAGGLMRLTAGKGLWHGEGGGGQAHEVVEGLQFWVNLAKDQKKIEPSFQAAADADLPRRSQDDGRASVKVLVGPGSPVKIVTPMVYVEATLKPGGRFQWELPKEHQGFVYVLEGQALFPVDEARAAADQVAVLGEGAGIVVENDGKGDLVFLLAAGEPHRESVVWNGPFVD